MPNCRSSLVLAWLFMLAAGTILCDATAGQTNSIATVSAISDSSSGASSPLATDGQHSVPSIDQFTVVTTVSVDGQPIQNFRTIHREGVAVQVTGDGSRYVTLYDDDSVTMLDRKKQTRCEISHQELVDITMATAAMIRGTERHQSLGVDVAPERRGDAYLAEFGPFKYQITSAKSDLPNASKDFAKVADAAARLNLVRSTGLPPFARLAISRELVRDGRLPVKTEVTFKRGPNEVQTFVSVDRLIQSDVSDQQRFDSVKSMQALYQTISMDQF